MNFKINTNLNLSKIKKYTNVSANKIDYNHQNLATSFPDAESNDFESQFNVDNQNTIFNKMGDKLIDSSLEAIKENMINHYNYTYFNSTDLENMYNIFASAKESVNTPTQDLATTDVQTVENFNQIIKDNVNTAGYGTREGVVAAALSLVVGYPTITGSRLRYSQGYRQDYNTEGIVNDNFYLDCSSFAWWALYNGGFNIPKNADGTDIPAYTGTQRNWALNNSFTKSINEGQPGDFLVCHNSNAEHIVIIVGKYDEGYYCVEFSQPGEGGKMTMRKYTDLENAGYNLIDMDQYYNNASNVRQQ